jgi:hypothetical protein
VKIILWIVVVYAVICVVAYFGNRRFMYFPDPARTPPAEAGLDSIKEVEIATTSRPSFISMATAPTQPIAHQKSMQSSRAALAFFTLITVAMAAQAESPRKRTILPMRSPPTTTWLNTVPRRTKSSPMASLWALVRRSDWQRKER